MKKIFLLAMLLISCEIYSQDNFEKIVKETCVCMKEQGNDKEDMKALLKCVMVASIPYEEMIESEMGFSVNEYDGMVEFLLMVGPKMVKACPEVTASIFLNIEVELDLPIESNGTMICNTTDDKIMVALGFDLEPKVSAGWYELGPDKCTIWGNDVPEDILYYYAFSTENEIAWKSKSDKRFNISFDGSFTIKGDDNCFGCNSAQFKKYEPTVLNGQKGVFISKSDASNFISYRTVRRSKFKFCNKTNEDVIIAIGLDKNTKFSTGWFLVKPNDCFETEHFLPEELLHYYAFNSSGYEWKDENGVKFKTNNKDVFSLKEDEFCANCDMEGYVQFKYENRIENSEFQTINFFLSDAQRPKTTINPIVALFTFVAGAAILFGDDNKSIDYSSDSYDRNQKWSERQKQVDYDIRRAEQREAERGNY